MMRGTVPGWGDRRRMIRVAAIAGSLAAGLVPVLGAPVSAQTQGGVARTGEPSPGQPLVLTPASDPSGESSNEPRPSPGTDVPGPVNAEPKAEQPQPSEIIYSINRMPTGPDRETPVVPAILTLRDAVLYALERSGSVSESRADMEIAWARVQEMIAARYPEVSAFVSTGISHGGDADDRKTLEQAEVGLSLSTVLYDWGARERRIDEARQRLESDRASAEDAIDRLIFGVIDAFYEVAVRRNVVKVQRWALSELERFAAQFEGPVADGVMPLSFGDNIEALVAQRQTALTVAIREEEIARAQLAVLVGFEVQEVADPAISQLPFVTVEQAVSMSRARSPQIRQAEAEVEAAKAATRAVRADSSGRLTADAEVATGHNVSGDDGSAFDASLGMTYRIPLFDGGRRQAIQMRAVATVSSAAGQLDQVRQNVELDVRRAWEVLRVAEDVIDQQAVAALAFNRTTRAFADDVAAGQRQPIELPGLLGSYADAEIAWSTSYFARQLAIFNLLRHTGDAYAMLGVDQARADLLQTDQRSARSALGLWIDRILSGVQ